ncbi:hypothetical protein Ancab_015618 [Ancistrocladus abbreviatus]
MGEWVGGRVVVIMMREGWGEERESRKSKGGGKRRSDGHRMSGWMGLTCPADSGAHKTDLNYSATTIGLPPPLPLCPLSCSLHHVHVHGWPNSPTLIRDASRPVAHFS